MNEKRDWTDRKFLAKDTSKMQNNLAVFNKNDNQFYKIAVIDMRGLRFELSGKTKTVMLSFDRGEMFFYTDDSQFSKFYSLYSQNNKTPLSKEEVLKWLSGV